ncbi:arad-like aldolase/epimerase [Annulohypoxylon truncatum]|uniref:arad-like aldolase/epimerase n=1 Tax=Annulohypoxylon truncatum TaxID=327061 RepID=UPI002007274E|nr:arad-like aldolase/epimerase [Annulohypoxylon truncatum]KAI1210392.1 arad-like aldolase/epimerase [Annulohypoxylon truncatum]
MAPSAITEEPVLGVSPLKGQDKPSVVEGKEKTPLEAISHGILMPGIPTFPDYTSHRRHILVHMAATFRFFARSGFTEGQSGHISVRDPEFNGLMWMNPLGRHFGMLTAGDMICLDIATGKIVGGNTSRPANAAGYLIHSAVHKRRPNDIHAICHAHSNAGRAWSVFARPLEMLNQDVCNFHNAHAVYARYGGIVFASEEGEYIAEALGTRNKGVILMNHGLLTVGHTVDEAGFMFGLLDRACAMQLQVEAAAANGIPKNIISDEEAAFNFKMASESNILYREAQPDLEYEIEAAGGEDAVARGFDALQRVAS